ncbi:glycoside hydrolase family 16 protein [Curvularia clavata]|uniref:Glycoside hydrolase family 16 protein n=1 Tax=Curvularia clavata TaxID=95742 RepID=A0A9Q8Z703_CURCL|nr:glycoside hydrolase family 16 protein [Curvularia clavata]
MVFTPEDASSVLSESSDGQSAQNTEQLTQSPSTIGAGSEVASPSNGTSEKATPSHGDSVSVGKSSSPLPFAPFISSPLNPARTTSAEHGSSLGTHAQSGNETQADNGRTQTNRGRPHPRPPPRPYLRAQSRSTTDLDDPAPRCPGTPITVNELGIDYTRYFKPFSDCVSTPSSSRRDSSERLAQFKLTVTPPTTTPPPRGSSLNPFLTPGSSETVVQQGPRNLYDAEKNASLFDDRLIAPYDDKDMATWPLVCDQAEADDEMHMPREDDDVRFRPKIRDHLTKESIASTIGLVLMISGLVFIFVGLPVLSSVGLINYNSAYGVPINMFPNWAPQTWATVNHKRYQLLQNMRRGLIDPDTPKSVKTRKGQFGDEFVLVFSDEFNDDGRSFYEGDDPYFFAPDIWYGATQDLEWYDPDAVTTHNGSLRIRLEEFFNHGLKFRSGMLNSWNQLCFKGGIYEVSVSLPGPAGVQGLWPGAWTMGNLGRPGYLSTTDGLWPYTYQACDVGITPNQSSPDGLSHLPGQRLPSCTCPGEDHPTPGTGRGAPEIDIIEVGAFSGYPGPDALPIATQSYQVAPFDINYYPNYNFTAFPDLRLSGLNTYTGGPFQQTISATTTLNRNWFDNKQYQRFSFEYKPGTGKDAYIVWKVGDQMMFHLNGRAIGPNGNIQARQISEEPMSLILNLGFSNSWTYIDWKNLVFPTTLHVDYVRWYQKKGEEMVTCDPPGYETTEYIKKHPKAYTNANYTV